MLDVRVEQGCDRVLDGKVRRGHAKSNEGSAPSAVRRRAVKKKADEH
jgi:hypothetical protein